jgi:hypothetical protein
MKSGRGLPHSKTQAHSVLQLILIDLPCEPLSMKMPPCLNLASSAEMLRAGMSALR